MAPHCQGTLKGHRLGGITACSRWPRRASRRQACARTHMCRAGSRQGAAAPLCGNYRINIVQFRHPTTNNNNDNLALSLSPRQLVVARWPRELATAQADDLRRNGCAWLAGKETRPHRMCYTPPPPPKSIRSPSMWQRARPQPKTMMTPGKLAGGQRERSRRPRAGPLTPHSGTRRRASSYDTPPPPPCLTSSPLFFAGGALGAAVVAPICPII